MLRIRHSIQAFNNQLGALAKQYNDARRDLERERVASRLTQEHAESLARKLKAVEESAVGIPGVEIRMAHVGVMVC